jgi:hypothetical protein
VITAPTHFPGGPRGRRIAYADPPYPGQAERHYGPDAKEVYLPALLDHLQTFDGWALHCDSGSLPLILPLTPTAGLRICAWVKPWVSFKPGVTLAYAWEPVLVRPARSRSRMVTTTRDWHSASATTRCGVAGAKPLSVILWVLRLLGAQQQDDFTDLFPGTGFVGETWAAFTHHGG